MVTLKKLWYNMADKTDYSYIAGIIDSDGCIQIYNSPSRGRQSWSLTVDVTNRSKKMMDKLVGIFGGNYCQKKSMPGKYECYSWYIHGGKAYKMLKKVKRYLIEKKAQADIGIQFFIHQKRTTRPDYKGLTDSTIRKRQEFKRRLRELKTTFLVPRALAETECENAVMGEATVQPN